MCTLLGAPPIHECRARARGGTAASTRRRRRRRRSGSPLPYAVRVARVRPPFVAPVRRGTHGPRARRLVAEPNRPRPCSRTRCTGTRCAATCPRTRPRTYRCASTAPRPSTTTTARTTRRSYRFVTRSVLRTPFRRYGRAGFRRVICDRRIRPARRLSRRQYRTKYVSPICNRDGRFVAIFRHTGNGENMASFDLRSFEWFVCDERSSRNGKCDTHKNHFISHVWNETKKFAVLIYRILNLTFKFINFDCLYFIFIYLNTRNNTY